MPDRNKQSEHWKVLVMLLKEIAEDKGITQQQIADETGLIQSNVSRLFSMKYKPNLDVFLKVAQAVKVNFFFEDQEGKTELNVLFEKAMEKMHRRDVDNLS
jgi:transcriptional regulator with XRE-family HTH domain